MSWQLHIANASGALTPHLDRIRAAIDAARDLAAPHLPEVTLDLVVQHWPGRVIPGYGHMGYAPTGYMIQLTFDTSDRGFSAHLDAPLTRTVLHELHHLHRWRGPGYGTTLGEALVSEGLAGHFVRQLCATPPEPWERAVAPDTVARHLATALRHWDQPYDHAAWFFGTGDLPNNLGYTLGYHLLGSHLSETAGTAAGLVHAPARDVRPTLEALAA